MGSASDRSATRHLQAPKHAESVKPLLYKKLSPTAAHVEVVGHATAFSAGTASPYGNQLDRTICHHNAGHHCHQRDCRRGRSVRGRSLDAGPFTLPLPIQSASIHAHPHGAPAHPVKLGLKVEKVPGRAWRLEVRRVVGDDAAVERRREVGRIGLTARFGHRSHPLASRVTLV
jgi:hypothetical protein